MQILVELNSLLRVLNCSAEINLLYFYCMIIIDSFCNDDWWCYSIIIIVVFVGRPTFERSDDVIRATLSSEHVVKPLPVPIIMSSISSTTSTSIITVSVTSSSISTGSRSCNINIVGIHMWSGRTRRSHIYYDSCCSLWLRVPASVSVTTNTNQDSLSLSYIIIINIYLLYFTFFVSVTTSYHQSHQLSEC